MKIHQLTTAALFAALTAVATQISIPLPGLVPLNLATLSVFLCGALLGMKWGFISQLVYLCIGLVGVPVFSGFGAGPSKLVGPTGGYLIGYLLAALLVGLLMQAKPVKWMLPVSMIVGLAACYALGTAWYMYVTNTQLLPSLVACVFPFLAGDAIKIAAACLIVSRIGVLSLARPRVSA